MRFKLFSLGALFVGLVHSSFGAPIYSACVSPSGPTACTFTGTGIITVAGPVISWKSDAAGSAANFFTFGVPAGNTSVFSAIPNGSQEGIANLTLAADPVNTLFGPNPFFTFPTDAALVPNGALNINFISPGIDSTLTCGGVPASGQTCTPAIAPGVPGPFNFANFVDPNFGLSSTATFNFSGVSADGSGRWSTIFTSQFLGQSFQSVLNQLAVTGSVTNAYSQQTLVVVPTTVPEPASLLLIGTGLIGLAAFVRRRVTK